MSEVGFQFSGPMTLDKFREFVAAHTWRFARSMPHTPHWYVVRWDKYERLTCRSDAEFQAAVEFILATGDRRPYGKHRRHYIDVDGFCYWSMELVSPAETTILNREKSGRWDPK